MLRVRHADRRYDEAGNVIPPGFPGDRRAYLVLRSDTVDVYAETAAEILTELIDGYHELDHRERLQARMRHAAGVKFRLSAQLVGMAEQPPTGNERAALLAEMWDPPTIPVWTCVVPLVLFDVFYRPFGTAAPPLGNVLWLRPSREMPYLVSLAEAGVVVLECPR